jgi:hypothetical protein
MSAACRYCGSSQIAGQDNFITGGVCASCAEDVLSTRENTQRFINSLASPIIIMQGDPHLAVTANGKASQLLGKDLSQILGQRSGQVFDCIHSFSDLGCGRDLNCGDCNLVSAVAEALSQKKSSTKVFSLLDVLRQGRSSAYNLEVSTEPIGDLALMRIDQYGPAE